ncbi:MAG: aminotransferase class I/II-fold pyridoxal phosphate-dependent enzyme [Saprospiraceae bacterium]
MIDWETEITITAGATQAIFTAILTLVHPGDEVILLEPAYDSYRPAIQMCGGIPVINTLAFSRLPNHFGQTSPTASPPRTALPSIRHTTQQAPYVREISNTGPTSPRQRYFHPQR